MDPHDPCLWPFPPGSKRRTRDFFRTEKKFRRKNAAIFAESVVLEVSVPLKVEIVRRFLPAWLSLDANRPGIFFAADHVGPAFCQRYIEVGFMLPVRTPTGRGIHITWMVVNNDTALLLGREGLAVPKKMADLAFEYDCRSPWATVRRHGAEFLRLDAEATGAVARADPFYDQATYNVGGMGQMVLWSLIWVYRATETISGARAMRASLRTSDVPFDPVTRMFARTDDLEARLFTVTCHHGRYLLPAGIAGPRWFGNTYEHRFR